MGCYASYAQPYSAVYVGSGTIAATDMVGRIPVKGVDPAQRHKQYSKQPNHGLRVYSASDLVTVVPCSIGSRLVASSKVNPYQV
jgi:hypothetical protein